MESAVLPAPVRLEARLACVFFMLCLSFNFWGVRVGWESRNLPGGEFRQAQTALSAYWIKAENNFSLAYPTPVLGQPWSIPMEFPLYQWTVVVTGKLTGWGLTKAGRAVSIACFYLCLPAVFLLLARWRVAPGHRWLVLAVIVTCPLYIYYGRAFLIETMALMFGLWFWVAFERAVIERSRLWFTVAVVAGTGAGLVKVTTFLLYLLPVGIWAARRLWSARQGGEWRRDCAWMAGILAPSFAATIWWVRFADMTKLANPLGRDLVSASLRSFNLGTNATRFSAEMWQTKLGIVAWELTWLPVLLLGAILVFSFGRARWREIAGCTVVFGSVLFLFPGLYTYHTYYYVANAVLLTMALGLTLVALAESRLRRGVVWLAVMLVTGGQIGHYLRAYYPSQAAVTIGGDALSRSLETLTQPDDVLVVLGQDWNSMLPYYAKRRALMLRDDMAQQPARVAEALAALHGVKIGALVIAGTPDGREGLLERAVALGISRQALYVWGNTVVYVPAERHAALVRAVASHPFAEISFAPGVEVPQAKVVSEWCNFADLEPWQRPLFAGMQPKPIRFFSTYGPALAEADGRWLFGAHPVTRLVFALPAGRHVLRTTLGLPEEAYGAALTEADSSDGVEVSLFALGAGEERRLVATRHFDPRHNAGDRGMEQPMSMEFILSEAGEVELYFGPGPQDRVTRDWIRIGALTID